MEKLGPEDCLQGLRRLQTYRLFSLNRLLTSYVSARRLQSADFVTVKTSVSVWIPARGRRQQNSKLFRKEKERRAEANKQAAIILQQNSLPVNAF